MEKISENSILYEFIHKPLLSWVLLYFLSTFGVFFKYYFNLKDNFWCMIITFLLFMVILSIFGILQWKSSNEILNDNKLNWESKKYLLDYNHDLYYMDKKMFYLKFLIIVIFTFLIGINAGFLDKMTLVDFTNYILTTFGISICSLHLLMYDAEGDTLINNSLFGSYINIIIVLFLSILKFNLESFIRIF